MTMEDIEARVRPILSETLEVDAASITPDANLLEDLGADSLMMLEVLARLDGEFGISIEQSQLAQMVSLEAIARIVSNALTVGA